LNLSFQIRDHLKLNSTKNRPNRPYSSSKIFNNSLIIPNSFRKSIRNFKNSDNTIKNLEEENKDLIKKLKILNKELSKIVDKALVENTNKAKNLPIKENEIIDKEIINSNKVLSNLIKEYNNLYKKFYVVSEPEYSKNLIKIKEELDIILVEFQDQNKKIALKNKNCENELKKSVNESYILENRNDLNYKIEKYQEGVEKKTIMKHKNLKKKYQFFKA